MTRPDHSHKEKPSTYFVQDLSSKEERMRLHIQGQMLTTSMGGALQEQPDPTRFHSLLDVGCGTGDWLIEVAKAYPGISRLVGIDIGSKMLDYAHALAKEQGVSERIEFLEMDALGKFEFPGGTFDLVNERFGVSFIRIWEWPMFLEQCQRVARPGGVIRITESDFAENNSPALNRFFDLLLQSFYNAGNFFKLERRAMIDELANMLTRYGIDNVQTCVYAIDCSFGTPAWQPYCEDLRHSFRTALPFLRKWTRVPEDYERICQQALDEIRQPDFTATWTLLTAWGTNRGW